MLREYNLAENSTWDAANEKIERRTPYMKEWGDNKSIATTSEEATDIWLQVKAKEVKNTFMQSVLEKYLREQKKRDAEEEVVALSDESFETETNELESKKDKDAEEESNDKEKWRSSFLQIQS